MGRIYSPDRVAAGKVPDSSGMDQLKAGRLFLDSLADSPVTQTSTRVLVLGSTATGHANRRSDVDYFLVRRPIYGEMGVAQQLHIRSALYTAAERYNVHFEGQEHTEEDIKRAGEIIHDPLWLAHALDIQDRYPEWSHGNPVETLRPYSIDIHSLETPAEASLAGAVVTRYLNHKVRLFSEAGEYDPASHRDLMLMQRALESGKAYARKMMAISALEGCEIVDPDVTSKASMQEQTEELLDRIDANGTMKRHHEFILELDNEYNGVLDEALKTGNVRAYNRWLGRHYLVACGAALNLARGYLWHTDGVTLAHPDVCFAGLDVESSFDDEFALNNSCSEPLVDSADGGVREYTDPILINMSAEQIDEMIAKARATASENPSAERLLVGHQR